MRGKRLHDDLGRNGHRIIPASAGQTKSGLVRSSIPTDHPRECGANSIVSQPLSNAVGSSPRVRGKHLPLHRRRARRRIIPASAGQTGSSPPSCAPRADHPRECGANWVVSTFVCPKSGSSPRVRGKQGENKPRQREHRIIPASAGQTPIIFAACVTSSDHPRECGANAHGATRRISSNGSSPRVRGKHVV